MAVDIFAVFAPASGNASKIVGETTNEAYKSRAGAVIELASFSMGAENPAVIGSASGGAGVAKARFNPIEIVHHVGAASPGLFQAMCIGAHFDSVSFEFVKAGGAKGRAGKPFYVVNCKLVMITGIEQSASTGDDVLLEKITLQCGAIQVTYTLTDAAGRMVGNSPTATWSQVRNTGAFEV
jgi:type VI secretion system Hcp family effector